MSAPRLNQVRPREKQTIDAQKLFRHTTLDGSLWEGALCASSQFPDRWYPEMRGNAIPDEEIMSINMALQICDACPIRQQCLEIGMQEIDVRYGIWGGMLAGERLALRAKLTGKQAIKVHQEAISGARMVRARISKLNGVKL